MVPLEASKEHCTLICVIMMIVNIIQEKTYQNTIKCEKVSLLDNNHHIATTCMSNGDILVFFTDEGFWVFYGPIGDICDWIWCGYPVAKKP